MAKNIIAVLIFITCLFIIVNIGKNYVAQKSIDVSKSTPFITPSFNKTLAKITTSIFVPYWSDFKSSGGLTKYDRIIYFGVAPDSEGVNKNDQGYKNIENFISQDMKGKEKWLTLRMTNTENNLGYLKNLKTQEKIITESIDLVKKYRFDGLVLDLEINSIAYDELIQQINKFVQTFYISSKKQNIRSALTLYGDNFFRKRPFDLAFLEKNSDEFLIMAYDFHKARGEPGPNFPMKKGEKFGYDYKALIDDFGKYIPVNKLTVIFGMYGYDWIVDEKKRPIKQATALTLNEINNKILPDCKKENCVIKRDGLSKETEINYVDKYLNLHIIWFEDDKSVEEKISFLKEKGIFNFAYWAYSYF